MPTLSFESDSHMRELDTKRGLVDVFEQTGAQRAMYLDGCAYYFV